MGWSIFKSKKQKEDETTEILAVKARKWEENQRKLKHEYENPPIDEPVKAIIKALEERPNTFSLKTTRTKRYRVSDSIVRGFSEIIDRKTGLKLTLHSVESRSPNVYVILNIHSEYHKVLLGRFLIHRDSPIAMESYIPYYKVETAFKLSDHEKVHLSIALQDFIRTKRETTKQRWEERKRNRYIKMYSDLED